MYLHHDSKKQTSICFNFNMNPNRGRLVKQLAEEKGIKVSELIREAIYEHLRKNLSKELYSSAVIDDQNYWKQVVDNRLEGRASSKLLRFIQSSK